MSKTKKNRKAGPKPNHRQFKLPPGVVLLAKPIDPGNDFKCVRCDGGPNGTGYEWTSRKRGELPARCPHCSSPSWNKARLRATRSSDTCACKFCGWVWTAVAGALPAQCSNCKKFNWNHTAGLPPAKPQGVK